MLNQKHKNSYIYEEELDHENNEKISLNKETSIEHTEVKIDYKDYMLRVEGEDIRLDNDLINILAVFLKENVKDIKAKRIILPKWIEKKILELYFNILITNKLPKFDLTITKKLICLSEFLNNPELIKSIINECLFPNLDKLTCLRILRDYIDLIQNNQTRFLYFEIIQKCIEIASKNIFYLINNNQEDLALLKEDSLEEIIEKYFESVRLNTNIDNSLIMRLMIKIRKLSDIFELLENERKRSLTIFEKISNDGLEPTITWKLNNSNNYKESDEFLYEDINVVLINYYDSQNDIFQIGIKINGINNEQSQNRDQSSIIVSFLTICEIKELNYRSKTNFHCIYNNSKAKMLLCKIENFSKLLENTQNRDYTLSIYFNLSCNFSSILSHICKNFYEFYSLNSISKIPKNVLNIIIKNKFLNVRNEDEVLFSIITYLNNKQHFNSESIEELFKMVNWSSVTLDGLLEFILNESKLLLNSSNLQEMLITEFRRRFKDDYINSNIQDNDGKLQLSLDSIKMVSPKNRSITKTVNSKQSFTGDLQKLILEIASRYESHNKANVYSNNPTSTNTNTNSNIHTNQNHHNKLKNSYNSTRNNYIDDSKYPSNANHFSPEISENSNIKSSLMNVQLSSNKDVVGNSINDVTESKQKTLRKSSSTLFNKKNLVLPNNINNPSEKPTTNSHLNNFLLNSDSNKGQSKSLDRVKSPGNIPISKSEVNANFASPKKSLTRDRSEQNFISKNNLEKLNNNQSIEKKVNPLSSLSNYTNRNISQKTLKLQQSTNQNSSSFRSKMNDKSLEIKKKTLENKGELTKQDLNLKLSQNKNNNSGGYLNNKLKIPDNNIKLLKYNNFTKPKSVNVVNK